MKTLSFTLLLICLSNLLYSQTPTLPDSVFIRGQQLLAQAVNQWQETKLLEARAYWERLNQPGPQQWLVHYYISLADSRLISFYFSKKNTELVKRYIDDGIEHLQQGLKQNERFAEAHSLLSNFYGHKIGTNPLLGITLGPRGSQEMDRARALESKNPRTYLIAGWSAYYTPALFGGGLEKARVYFQQAIHAFPEFQSPTPILPDWGEAEAHAWLGLVHQKNGDYASAQTQFEKALALNPDYTWVKYVLLPALKEKKLTQFE
ncbi:tetratricopeptide repeat protein [candidate division KSB1 bacterium]|nr:tetratricopeptide repeat protein [candidate division KSB1 bacterium]